MKYLTIDAGPFIGLFYAKDNYHQQYVNGFAQLAKDKTVILTPIPIIFGFINGYFNERLQ